MPWLKLASFGTAITAKGSLRHNANLLKIEGIEGDHDAGTMTLEEAAKRLENASLAALLYTSPSHTSAKPRWRVLCPTSEALAPSERERLCARLNGVLGGCLSLESFTLSQAYYYGSVSGNPAHKIKLTEGDPIDFRPDLDGGALDKVAKQYEGRLVAGAVSKHGLTADSDRVVEALAGC